MLIQTGTWLAACNSLIWNKHGCKPWYQKACSLVVYQAGNIAIWSCKSGVNISWEACKGGKRFLWWSFFANKSTWFSSFLGHYEEFSSWHVLILAPLYKTLIIFFFIQELKRFDTAICALHLKAPHAVTRVSLSGFGHRVNSAASLMVLGNWAVSSTLPYGMIFLLQHIRQWSVLANFKPFKCWWEIWGSLSLSKVMCLSHSSVWLYSVVFFVLLGNCEVFLLTNINDINRKNCFWKCQDNKKINCVGYFRRFLIHKSSSKCSQLVSTGYVLFGFLVLSGDIQ